MELENGLGLHGYSTWIAWGVGVLVAMVTMIFFSYVAQKGRNSGKNDNRPDLWFAGGLHAKCGDDGNLAGGACGGTGGLCGCKG